MDIGFGYLDGSSLIKEEEYRDNLEKNLPSLEKALKGEEKYKSVLGWHKVSLWAGDEWLEKYEKTAERIKKDGDALVVIGIGGSNQAARAVYEALGQKNNVEIIWAGNTISSHSMNEVIEALDKKTSIYVDCIAKNFETLEPGIAFRVMRNYMKNRYGESYGERIYVTFTENTKSWKLAEDNGFTPLPFPNEIGGRFTALSPICLFPLAAAGFDIKAIARGAREMEERLKNDFSVSNIALQYATLRTMLKEKGKSVELLSYFEPRFFRFAKWWKQLFGESEGKNDKGLLPMDTSYSEDLHSLGQFVQEGAPMLFETFLDVKERESTCPLPSCDMDDGFAYLEGKDLWDINKIAFKATITAHSKRFPCLMLEVPGFNEETYGALFYFFQVACYVSCNITGVNPFDQEGVENYKREMFKLLGKY